MSDIVVDNSQVSQAPKFKFNSVFIIFGLAGIILLLMIATSFLILSPKKIDNQNPQKSLTMQEFTIEYRKGMITKYDSSANAFIATIQNLDISDALMSKIIDEPGYLATLSSVLERPNYTDMSLDQSKDAFRRSLVSGVNDVSKAADAFTQKADSNFSPELGRFLSILNYIAFLGHTPGLTSPQIATWKNSVDAGRATAFTIVEMMGKIYEPTGTYWMNNNLFNQPEFKF